MKVLIAVDYEGVAGMVTWDSNDNARMREFITADANAAVAGCFDAGADQVLITEAHASMRNLIPEEVDERARYLSGQPKPLNHVGGVDESFDAAMFVAYHARSGALRGIMAHTYNTPVFSLSFNGIEVGEFGADAAICGAFGVPVVMVSGDNVLAEEAAELVPGIETVIVKEGISRSAGICIPPGPAREMIREGAARALARREEIQPFVIEPPVRCEVVFTDPSYPDTLTYLPFVERVDGRTIAFEAETMPEAFELFNALHFLAGKVR